MHWISLFLLFPLPHSIYLIYKFCTKMCPKVFHLYISAGREFPSLSLALLPSKSPPFFSWNNCSKLLWSIIRRSTHLTLIPLSHPENISFIHFSQPACSISLCAFAYMIPQRDCPFLHISLSHAFRLLARFLSICASSSSRNWSLSSSPCSPPFYCSP